MNSPTRIAALGFVAITMTATLTGCGSDDDPGQSTSSSSDGAARSADPGNGGGVGTSLDTYGSGASIALSSIEGYEIDGSRIVFDATSIEKDAGSSHCIVLTTVAKGVSLPPDTSIVVNFSDGSETCDLKE